MINLKKLYMSKMKNKYFLTSKQIYFNYKIKKQKKLYAFISKQPKCRYKSYSITYHKIYGINHIQLMINYILQKIGYLVVYLCYKQIV